MTLLLGLFLQGLLAAGLPAEVVESVGTASAGVPVVVQPVCSDEGPAPQVCLEWPR